ncbi:MAG: ATP-binding protein [Clostridia bacterium]
MKYISRSKYLQLLINYKDKDLAKVITGIRRSGKSVLLFDIFYDYLLSQGIDKEHIVKIDLETARNKELRDPDKLYAFVTSKLTDDGRYYVFLDEIQLCPNFEDVVNGLRLDHNCDMYLTGSNSKLLSKEINTKLRGRSIEIKMQPLSFGEYYSFVGGDKNQAFNDFLLFGGLPYLLDEQDANRKIEYLRMMCDTVIAKDIIDRYQIRNENLFNAVFEFLCSNIGSYVSVSKIVNTIKSNGYSAVTDDTVGNYVTYMCDAYLFYKAQRFDIKGKAYLKTQNKYYISDLGIRNSKLNYRQIEVTHSLENIIYLELIGRGYVVDIGKNNEKEIDFIAKSSRDLFYIQVAYSIVEPSKKEQELASFKNLDDGYKKIVITMDNDPFTLLQNGYKKINVFDFLLNDNALEEL